MGLFRICSGEQIFVVRQRNKKNNCVFFLYTKSFLIAIMSHQIKTNKWCRESTTDKKEEKGITDKGKEEVERGI